MGSHSDDGYLEEGEGQVAYPCFSLWTCSETAGIFYQFEILTVFLLLPNNTAAGSTTFKIPY